MSRVVKLLSSLLLVLTITGESMADNNLFDANFMKFLKRAEGERVEIVDGKRRHYVYSDKTGDPWRGDGTDEGNPTIGHGHLVSQTELDKYLREGMTDVQAKKQRDKDLSSALKRAKASFRSNWNQLSKNGKQIAVDIAYNTGNISEKEWPNLRKGLITNNWDIISQEYTRKGLEDRDDALYEHFIEPNLKGKTMAENKEISEIAPDKMKTPVLSSDQEKIAMTDPFSDSDVDQFFAERSVTSQGGIQQMQEKMMIMANKLMFSGERVEQIAQNMVGKDPITGPQQLAGAVLDKVSLEIRKAGDVVPPAAKVGVAAKVLGDTYEIYKVANPETEVTEKHMQAGMAVMIQDHLNKEIQAGRIDKEELAQEFGDSVVNDMSQEQRRYLDQQLKQIDDTVQQTVQGDQMPGKPQAPAPAAGGSMMGSILDLDHPSSEGI
jgi:GH24 family phage-related lysozyme (muramidase)